MHTRQEQLEAVDRLLTILDELRVKCPWDKKQTFDSLKNLTVEEMYELVDAITEGDTDEMKKELGDLLMHIVFYAKIGSEQSLFDIKDIADSISDKLVFRHPHIYGDVKVDSEKDVLANWEKLKLKEGNKSVLAGVPKGLPALIKAYRIQEKASGVGFDWDEASDVWKKVEEEIEEFKVEVKADNQDLMEEEFGDILFTLVNYARHKGIDPEKALARSNSKFISRFNIVEELVNKEKGGFEDVTLQELDEYWNKAKK
ncbi:nucleoside triphosphate pyrophosphohydrolase [Myroides odoratimimus]|uniref:nucleoside triphosphate pyrophosphohydrolase n=1 Tax=Myroides odoratimimus TaxID=76832 RepID=UPI002579078F|nr:nucleoside triphosphate pyrophosphohydrolase [Myroides odoratimimus]MDM1098055.1 nucleoside triphosphate pyrophosphohydrolase [Myroides odoratimimus]MDM1328594.1 nucleoside triphosphate pyrophosphohydrolase [Myroides odoratimimus]MDM1443023.1 nucleoside triphosphate pyrophosphohydrolase [Myroides odoratimimus]MDM1448459.1 nucleoside triphosphate pyrophosphohydrolase [Myroides odoratimimus]MDM1453561.1 nucleoside triphosphate pyrophosphohydrolase [Myroides odoratimimus]